MENYIKRTLVLILGGGAGTRLYPLTESRSKPAVPIAGKYRLIDIPISNCLNSQLNRIFVLTQYNSASLNRHIKNTYQFDRFSRGFVDILAAEQTRSNLNWFQGTADAVRQVLPRLGEDYDYILILSGDQLYQMDFNFIMKHHIEKDADVTVATIPVDARDATSFGIMKVNEASAIYDFVEKPNMDEVMKWQSPVAERYAIQGKNFLASMGIYLFKRQVIYDLLEKQEDAVDFGKEIIPQAVHDNLKVSSYPYGGYWTDIGNIDSFFKANLELTDDIPQFHLFDNINQIYTNARMLSPSKIFGTKIERALISSGCIIHADYIERSIIGIRSRVGSGTIIKNAIVMGNDYYQTVNEIMQLELDALLGVGRGCYIENVIVDKNAKISDDVHIVGGPELEDVETNAYCIREGIIIIKKQAHIPKGSRIGVPIDPSISSSKG